MAWLRQAAVEAPPHSQPAPIGRRTEPSPADHPMAWADDGACTGMDPELFYPGRGEAITDEVITACRTCPVQAACLDWALRHERHGYWAGHSERSRRRLRRTLGIRLEDEDPTSTPTPEAPEDAA